MWTSLGIHYSKYYRLMSVCIFNFHKQHCRVCVCVCVYLEKEMATHFNISCLGNSMDRGARHATVHRVEKSRT